MALTPPFWIERGCVPLNGRHSSSLPTCSSVSSSSSSLPPGARARYILRSPRVLPSPLYRARPCALFEDIRDISSSSILKSELQDRAAGRRLHLQPQPRDCRHCVYSLARRVELSDARQTNRDACQFGIFFIFLYFYISSHLYFIRFILTRNR